MITTILTIRLKMYGKYSHDLDQPKNGHHILLEPRALVRRVSSGDTRVTPREDMWISLCMERDCPSLSFEISVHGIFFEVRARLQ
jgi:hypothetical protein